MSSFINYISFPVSVEELENKLNTDNIMDMEDILNSKLVCWTVSAKCNVGDVIFFIHTKSAKSNIIKVKRDLDLNGCFDERLVKDALLRAENIYKKYGGSLFAIGRVLGKPKYDGESFDYDTHFKNRTFANIGDITILDRPILTSEITKFYNLAQHYSNVPLKEEIYNQIKQKITEHNSVKFFDDIKKSV